MPARIKKIRHDENTRLKIKTSQLLNRLHDHVIDKVELSTTQIKAIEILLRKALPDLQSVSLTGADGVGPVIIQMVKYDDDDTDS
jgi:hypothetical protein